MPKISDLLPPPAPITGAETVPVVQGNDTWGMPLGEFLEETVFAATSEAAQSAAYAGGFEVPEYASQSAGNGVTTAGQIFRVPNGTSPQTFTWYRRLASGSELVSPLATSAALAATTGAGLVGASDGAGGSLWSTVSGFITYLRSSAGASIVQFIRAGANAVARSVQAKLRDTVSVKDSGAVGDGTAADGASLRASLSAFGNFGGLLTIPSGVYVSDASGGAALVSTKPVSIVGDGGIYTAINPSSATSSDNTLTYSPSTAFAHDGVRFAGFALHNPANGQRTGQHGIFLNTQTAGQFLPGLLIENVIVGAGSGRAIYHLSANNVNGGLYASTFRNNLLKGGIKLENSGDSINLFANVVTGANVGIDVSLIAGASCLAVEHNNITNDGGAFRLNAGARFRFVNNNCENYAAGAAANNGAAVVNIVGDNGVIYGGLIQGGLIAAFGTSDATHLLKLQNCRGTVIDNITFLSGGTAGTTAIEIGNTCQGVRVGRNIFNAAVTTRVVDNGIGTMGVLKPATLSNGWSNRANHEPMQFIKTGDGLVVLTGNITGGTSTNGTTLMTLPIGFRPAAIVRAPIFGVNAGVGVAGEIAIESNGVVSINFVSGCTILSINVTFAASDLGHAVSAE